MYKRQVRGGGAQWGTRVNNAIFCIKHGIRYNNM